jgi:hypothetical protein
MGLWVIYILSVIMGWFAARYVIMNNIGKSASTSLMFLFPFIPIVNVLLVALAVADIIISNPAFIKKGLKKFYFVKVKVNEECNNGK